MVYDDIPLIMIYFKSLWRNNFHL